LCAALDEPMTHDRELYAGRRLSERYELLVPLAQGATASVWAARTVGSALEKMVAIKAMLPEVCSDFDAEAMLVDEARLIARIDHPNVVTILDLGEHADTLYLVMEWIEGEPLQILMREARTTLVPLELALRIATKAAAGLHAAHEMRDESGGPIGLVHRDVSPQNILVGYDGSVKVIDFGIAWAVTNVQRTSVGQIKGKTSYMAPEQAAGQWLDRRADVFSLGVVLYQLVTGRHPFRGESEYATLARLNDAKPAAPPRSIVPSLPEDLDHAIVRAISKDREERFPTMLDFSRVLHQVARFSPDVDDKLGDFVGGLLSSRSAKRTQAIRDARKALRSGDARPTVAPIFDDGRVSIPDYSTPLDPDAALRIVPTYPPTGTRRDGT
jgi:serine/threonine-protein kinase